MFLQVVRILAHIVTILSATGKISCSCSKSDMNKTEALPILKISIKEAYPTSLNSTSNVGKSHYCHWSEKSQIFETKSSLKYVVLYSGNTALPLRLLREVQEPEISYWITDLKGIEIVTYNYSKGSGLMLTVVMFPIFPCANVLNQFVSTAFVPVNIIQSLIELDCTSVARSMSSNTQIEYGLMEYFFWTISIPMIFISYYIFVSVISSFIHVFTLRKLQAFRKRNNRYFASICGAASLGSVCETLRSHNYLVHEQLFTVEHIMHQNVPEKVFPMENHYRQKKKKSKCSTYVYFKKRWNNDVL